MLCHYGCCMGDDWKVGTTHSSGRLCTSWSRLRCAVLEGCSLRAAVVVLPPSEPATLDTTLHVPSTPSGNLGATDAMLDGPFTDVALTAGSRTFRAHRVVLAAASPVFLSMLDGAVREGREAAV